LVQIISEFQRKIAENLPETLSIGELFVKETQKICYFNRKAKGHGKNLKALRRST
jgi:hypothetical protein